MPQHERRGSTPTRRIPAQPRSPIKVLRQEAFQTSSPSPPSSPRRRREGESNGIKQARSELVTHKSVLEDADTAQDHDPEDPHDLELSARHIARASMFDNMVLSLDQLASGPIATRTYADHGKTDRNKIQIVSPSAVSGNDVKPLPTRAAPVVPPRSGQRASTKYARDPAKLPSIFGDDEDTTRVKVFDSQRAAQPSKQTKHRIRRDTEGSKSSGSSVDLGHLKKLQGRLGPAGNRRSQSFDFGSTRPKFDFNMDSAPPSAAFATSELPSSPSTGAFPVVVRRNSTKSIKNTQGSKTKTSTLGTTTLKSNTPLQLLPFRTDSALSNHADMLSPTALTANDGTYRPGLFKRFFSSSKGPLAPSNPSSPFNPGSARLSQDLREPRPVTPPNHPHRTPSKNGTEANKENVQPTVVKKTSFFRRRKKSIGNVVAPPLPLTLNSDLPPEIRSGEPSPVSSLKGFMDTYMNDENKSKEQQARDKSSTSFYHSNDNSAGTGTVRPDKVQQLKVVDGFQPSSTSKSSKANDLSRLHVSPKETFFAENSSAEDLNREQLEVNSRRSPVPPKRSNGTAAPRNFSTNSTLTIRPVHDTSNSLQLARPNLPARKHSLTPVEFEKNNNPSPTPTKLMTYSNLSGSDVSDYRSAPSTPMPLDVRESGAMSPTAPHLYPSISPGPDLVEADQARKIFEHGDDFIDGMNPAAWLGEAGDEREHIRIAFMELFDWTGSNIVAALRGLCSRLALKGESQLIDRILDAFAHRWCECNPNHGFKSADVVHTICYSVLLLNTDLHLADIGSKMTRSQFVKNSMQTIRPVVADASKSNGRMLTVRAHSYGPASPRRPSMDQSGRNSSALSQRPIDKLTRADSAGVETSSAVSGPLVEAPFLGSQSGWELQIEAVLKDFYYSISREMLPLFGSDQNNRSAGSANNANVNSMSGLRRTPSTVSKAQSEYNRGRHGPDSNRSLGARWASKTRSRPRLGSVAGFGSSRTSLEDGSSAWSPSISSTWSKVSLGKTLTSMSVDSFKPESTRGGDYKSSIGFANALSQSIVREDQMNVEQDEGIKAIPLLEDESLELEGAPWAKEGIVKHKCHLEGAEKRSKDRNWNDCFAVIEKGWMRLFSFSMTAKSLRNKARDQKAGGVVGGGNWQDNAEEVWKFMLRHTIASALPPPGYSKARPHVWALSLPTGAVHLFSVGTPDIVKEFVSTVNFWSARLSKEPMIGGVSSMEYGWSDAIVNRSLTASDSRTTLHSIGDPRPSTQLSSRSSFDQGNSGRPKVMADRIHISDWTPPQQSLLASQLLEVDQLRALQTYVQNVEEDLQKHNELRTAMNLTFNPKHPNHAKAMGNWEKKSSYLLREIVKFRTYIDMLQIAQQTKERLYKKRREAEEARIAHDEAMAMLGCESPSGTPFTEPSTELKFD